MGIISGIFNNAIVKWIISAIILVVFLWWGACKLWGYVPSFGWGSSSNSSVSGTVKELVTYLGDKVRGGRAYEAEKALVKESGKAVDELIDTMLKGKGEIPRRAAWTLIQIGPPAIEPLRTELACVQDEVTRRRIEFCLLHIREAIPQIKEEGYNYRKAKNSERMLQVIETSPIDSSPLPVKKKTAPKAKPAPKPVQKLEPKPEPKPEPPVAKPNIRPTSVGSTSFTPRGYVGGYRSVY
jgi:hypothetical protein